MKLGLFLGCNMPAIRPDAERAFRLTLPAFGLELVDLEGYACCPGYGTFPASDEEASLAVSARNLAIAEAKGVDIAVQCGSCYSVMRHARHSLHDHEKKDRVNELLKIDDKTFKGTSTTRHMIDLMYNEVGTEKIKKSLKYSLDGLTAVVQNPCHVLWPHDVMGFDDPRDPHMFRELVEALGAKVPRYSREYQCCGGAGGFAARNHPQAIAFAKRKYDAIVDEVKADLIVVSCVTCLMWMDRAQNEFKDETRKYGIPVFDYNQLVAICMGFDPKEVAGISVQSREKVIEKILKTPVAQAKG
ncbi:MAG: heterodisulfide reductase [Chloroflexi bacterium]|nr:heterodisulfide reductase [Chloroflexota bacterium]